MNGVGEHDHVCPHMTDPNKHCTICLELIAKRLEVEALSSRIRELTLLLQGLGGALPAVRVGGSKSET